MFTPGSEAQVVAQTEIAAGRVPGSGLTQTDLCASNISGLAGSASRESPEQVQRSASRHAAGKIRKPGSAVEIAASSTAQLDNCRNMRLFVQDRTTKIKFLVDSGADVSLIPVGPNAKASSEYKLFAANGTEIQTYGIKVLTLDLGLRRPFQWPFILAKVSKGTLGADFLAKFQLVIGIYQKKLTDGVTNLCIKSEIMSITIDNVVSTLTNNIKFSEILKRFPNITKPNSLNKNVKHNVQHYITTKGQPVYSRARQLDTRKLAKQEFSFMLDNGIIRPSKSP